MNTDSEQSGSSPVGTGEARLLFFGYFFFIVNIWTTETNFNKTLLSSEQSGSSPVGTGEARLLFFGYFFFIVNIWTTETNFNKTLLSSVPVLFTL